MARPVRWSDRFPIMEQRIAINLMRNEVMDTISAQLDRLAQLEAAVAEQERQARERERAARAWRKGRR